MKRDEPYNHDQARQAQLQAGAAKKSRPFRAVVLDRAIACTLGDRQEAYGPPSDALFLAAEFIRMYKQAAKGKYCAAHDEAIALTCLKLARIACGAVGHTDNYVDGAAYFAIAAECQQLNDQVSEAKVNAPVPVATSPLSDWMAKNDFVGSDRLKALDAKYEVYKGPKPLAFPKKVIVGEDGMFNPYAPVNKKV